MSRVNDRLVPESQRSSMKKKSPWRKPSKKKIGKVLKSIKEGNLNTPEDTLGTQHAAAVATGNKMRDIAQTSQPGRARAIIKNRRA